MLEIKLEVFEKINHKTFLGYNIPKNKEGLYNLNRTLWFPLNDTKNKPVTYFTRRIAPNKYTVCVTTMNSFNKRNMIGKKVGYGVLPMIFPSREKAYTAMTNIDHVLAYNFVQKELYIKQ